MEFFFYDIKYRKENIAALIDATNGVHVEISTEKISVCGCLLARIQGKVIM
jgi:hypothetical protein